MCKQGRSMQSAPAHDRLLANGYLDNNSIIFIDEIESALHHEEI